MCWCRIHGDTPNPRSVVDNNQVVFMEREVKVGTSERVNIAIFLDKARNPFAGKVDWLDRF